MTEFSYSITLLGADAEKATLNFNLQEYNGADEGADFIQAKADAGAIRTALLAVTDATVAEDNIRHRISAASTLPPEAEVWEEALVNVWLTPPTEIEKLHQVRIPAPKIGLFLDSLNKERDIVDKNDGDLNDYIDTLANYVTVSDGETIDGNHETLVKNGYKNVRKRRLGR